MLTQLAKAEGKIPSHSALARRPVLTEWQKRFKEAFYTLSSSRNYTSVGAASIPYPYIVEWLNEHHVFDLSDREEFVLIIQAMDNAYLAEINKNKPKG